MGGLADVVDELVLADISDLPFSALSELFVEVDRSIDRLHAVKLKALELIDRSGAAAATDGSTAAWLRAQTNCSGRTASRQVHLARDLADVLPAVASALAEGKITVEHAQVASGLRHDLPDHVVLAADASLAEAAAACTPTELREFVTTVRHSYKPGALADAERAAYDHRALHLSTTFGGVGVGDWTLDPVGHDTVMTAIHAASPPLPDDPRSGSQRHADGLVTISQFFNDHHADPGTGKKALPHVLVTVTLPTLTGEPGAPPASTGYGTSVSTHAVRRISCDAGISRVIFDPESAVIDVGRTHRLFTPATRKGIIARDKHCRWPGCTAPPTWCEAHHIIHWANGGPSDPENAILLCGRHHDKVHHHNHAIIINADGSRTVEQTRNSAAWLTPTDHRNKAGP